MQSCNEKRNPRVKTIINQNHRSRKWQEQSKNLKAKKQGSMESKLNKLYISLILLSSSIGLLKWCSNDFYWYVIINSLQLTGLFSFVILFSVRLNRENMKIYILFFINSVLEIIFIVNDVKAGDLYDTYFEYIHLVVILSTIYYSSNYLRSTK